VGRRVLAEAGGVRVTHDFEDVILERDGARLALADHYGDPQCALIAPERGWCVVGGEGLEVVRFDGPGAVRSALWRRDNAPPDGARCWFVSGLSDLGGDRVAVVAEVAGQAASFEVDVRTLAWRRT